MSDPIAQALAGTITWAQADLMYHSAFPPPRATVYRGHAHDDDAAPDDGNILECHQCTDDAVDECERCARPICGDHRAMCRECERYACDECMEEDYPGLCTACSPDQE